MGNRWNRKEQGGTGWNIGWNIGGTGWNIGGTTIYWLYLLPGCQFTIELAASCLFTVRSVNAWDIGGTGWNTSGTGCKRVEQSGTGWNIGGTVWNKVEQRYSGYTFFLVANSQSNWQPVTYSQ